MKVREIEAIPQILSYASLNLKAGDLKDLEMTVNKKFKNVYHYKIKLEAKE